MESEVVTLRKTRDDALTKADKSDTALTSALGGLAQRMEALAEKLAVNACKLSRRDDFCRLSPGFATAATAAVRLSLRSPGPGWRIGLQSRQVRIYDQSVS